MAKQARPTVCLHDRKARRLVAVENAADIDAGLPVNVHLIAPRTPHRRQPMAQREKGNLPDARKEVIHEVSGFQRLRLAQSRSGRYFGSTSSSMLRETLGCRLMTLALSRRKQGFESPRERQGFPCHVVFPLVFDVSPKPGEVVWAILFALCPSSLITAASARLS